VQRRFTGGVGKSLIERAEAFANALEKDGAFTAGWRGLDYGCGWGRIASYLLTKGPPEQLDLCDAWQGSLNYIDAGRFRNRTFLVSETVQAGEIETERYDFIYAFSIFTHLPRRVFESNLRELVPSVRHGGNVYFTVRHEQFLTHTNRADQVLDTDGFWFDGKHPAFGDAVVSRAFLERLAAPLGTLRYLGSTESMQELYALTRA
jgi:cyclopropane fatty-acyl-phospholipid synthase-like methyltransferase